jgi:hypothetical protein
VDETRLRRFKRIEARREFLVGGRDVDQTLMKVMSERHFVRGDHAEEKGRGIAVQIEIQNAASCFDVLLGQEPKQ